MEVSTEDVRQNFQSKADTELVELAASAKGLTSGARLILLQELENRLVSAKGAGETVQLIHGWYTVVAPTTGIKFPEFCPRCCRSETGTSLGFQSLEHRKFRLFYWKTERVVSSIPHCSDCARELKRTRAICSWLGGFLILVWFAAVIWFRFPRPLSYVGFFMISLPIAYLYDRPSAVKLGEYDSGMVEYRFKAHDYAKAFAALNNVQAENAETIQIELQEAISHLR